MKRKVLCVILALMMVVSLTPQVSFANINNFANEQVDEQANDPIQAPVSQEINDDQNASSQNEPDPVSDQNQNDNEGQAQGGQSDNQGEPELTNTDDQEANEQENNDQEVQDGQDGNEQEHNDQEIQDGQDGNEQENNDQEVQDGQEGNEQDGDIEEELPLNLMSMPLGAPLGETPEPDVKVYIGSNEYLQVGEYGSYRYISGSGNRSPYQLKLSDDGDTYILDLDRSFNTEAKYTTYDTSQTNGAYVEYGRRGIGVSLGAVTSDPTLKGKTAALYVDGDITIRLTDVGLTSGAGFSTDTLLSAQWYANIGDASTADNCRDYGIYVNGTLTIDGDNGLRAYGKIEGIHAENVIIKLGHNGKEANTTSLATKYPSASVGSTNSKGLYSYGRPAPMHIEAVSHSDSGTGIYAEKNFIADTQKLYYRSSPTSTSTGQLEGAIDAIGGKYGIYVGGTFATKGAKSAIRAYARDTSTTVENYGIWAKNFGCAVDDPNASELQLKSSVIYANAGYNSIYVDDDFYINGASIVAGCGYSYKVVKGTNGDTQEIKRGGENLISIKIGDKLISKSGEIRAENSIEKSLYVVGKNNNSSSPQNSVHIFAGTISAQDKEQNYKIKSGSAVGGSDKYDNSYGFYVGDGNVVFGESAYITASGHRAGLYVKNGTLTCNGDALQYGSKYIETSLDGRSQDGDGALLAYAGQSTKENDKTYGVYVYGDITVDKYEFIVGDNRDSGQILPTVGIFTETGDFTLKGDGKTNTFKDIMKVYSLHNSIELAAEGKRFINNGAKLELYSNNQGGFDTAKYNISSKTKPLFTNAAELYASVDSLRTDSRYMPYPMGENNAISNQEIIFDDNNEESDSDKLYGYYQYILERDANEMMNFAPERFYTYKPSDATTASKLIMTPILSISDTPVLTGWSENNGVVSYQTAGLKYTRGSVDVESPEYPYNNYSTKTINAHLELNNYSNNTSDYNAIFIQNQDVELTLKGTNTIGKGSADPTRRRYIEVLGSLTVNGGGVLTGGETVDDNLLAISVRMHRDYIDSRWFKPIDYRKAGVFNKSGTSNGNEFSACMTIEDGTIKANSIYTTGDLNLTPSYDISYSYDNGQENPPTRAEKTNIKNVNVTVKTVSPHDGIIVGNDILRNSNLTMNLGAKLNVDFGGFLSNDILSGINVRNAMDISGNGTIIRANNIHETYSSEYWRTSAISCYMNNTPGSPYDFSEVLVYDGAKIYVNADANDPTSPYSNKTYNGMNIRNMKVIGDGSKVYAHNSASQYTSSSYNHQYAIGGQDYAADALYLLNGGTVFAKSADTSAIYNIANVIVDSKLADDQYNLEAYSGINSLVSGYDNYGALILSGKLVLAGGAKAKIIGTNKAIGLSAGEVTLEDRLSYESHNDSMNPDLYPGSYGHEYNMQRWAYGDETILIHDFPFEEHTTGYFSGTNSGTRRFGVSRSPANPVTLTIESPSYPIRVTSKITFNLLDGNTLNLGTQDNDYAIYEDGSGGVYGTSDDYIVINGTGKAGASNSHGTLNATAKNAAIKAYHGVSIGSTAYKSDVTVNATATGDNSHGIDACFIIIGDKNNVKYNDEYDEYDEYEYVEVKNLTVNAKGKEAGLYTTGNSGEYGTKIYAGDVVAIGTDETGESAGIMQKEKTYGTIEILGGNVSAGFEKNGANERIFSKYGIYSDATGATGLNYTNNNVYIYHQEGQVTDLKAKGRVAGIYAISRIDSKSKEGAAVKIFDIKGVYDAEKDFGGQTKVVASGAEYGIYAKAMEQVAGMIIDGKLAKNPEYVPAVPASEDTEGQPAVGEPTRYNVVVEATGSTAGICAYTNTASEPENYALYIKGGLVNAESFGSGSGNGISANIESSTYNDLALRISGGDITAKGDLNGICIDKGKILFDADNAANGLPIIKTYGSTIGLQRSNSSTFSYEPTYLLSVDEDYNEALAKSARLEFEQEHYDYVTNSRKAAIFRLDEVANINLWIGDKQVTTKRTSYNADVENNNGTAKEIWEFTRNSDDAQSFSLNKPVLKIKSGIYTTNDVLGNDDRAIIYIGNCPDLTIVLEKPETASQDAILEAVLGDVKTYTPKYGIYNEKGDLHIQGATGNEELFIKTQNGIYSKGDTIKISNLSNFTADTTDISPSGYPIQVGNQDQDVEEDDDKTLGKLILDNVLDMRLYTAKTESVVDLVKNTRAEIELSDENDGYQMAVQNEWNSDSEEYEPIPYEESETASYVTLQNVLSIDGKLINAANVNADGQDPKIPWRFDKDNHTLKIYNVENYDYTWDSIIYTGTDPLEITLVDCPEITFDGKGIESLGADLTINEVFDSESDDPSDAHKKLKFTNEAKINVKGKLTLDGITTKMLLSKEAYDGSDPAITVDDFAITSGELDINWIDNNISWTKGIFVREGKVSISGDDTIVKIKADYGIEVRDYRDDYEGLPGFEMTGGNVTITPAKDSEGAGDGIIIYASDFILSGGTLDINNSAGRMWNGISVYDGNGYITGGLLTIDKALDYGIYLDCKDHLEYVTGCLTFSGVAEDATSTEKDKRLTHTIKANDIGVYVEYETIFDGNAKVEISGEIEDAAGLATEYLTFMNDRYEEGQSLKNTAVLNLYGPAGAQVRGLAKGSLADWSIYFSNHRVRYGNDLSEMVFGTEPSNEKYVQYSKDPIAALDIWVEGCLLTSAYYTDEHYDDDYRRNVWHFKLQNAGEDIDLANIEVGDLEDVELLLHGCIGEDDDYQAGETSDENIKARIYAGTPITIIPIIEPYDEDSCRIYIPNDEYGIYAKDDLTIKTSNNIMYFTDDSVEEIEIDESNMKEIICCDKTLTFDMSYIKANYLDTHKGIKADKILLNDVSMIDLIDVIDPINVVPEFVHEGDRPYYSMAIGQYDCDDWENEEFDYELNPETPNLDGANFFLLTANVILIDPITMEFIVVDSENNKDNSGSETLPEGFSYNVNTRKITLDNLDINNEETMYELHLLLNDYDIEFNGKNLIPQLITVASDVTLNKGKAQDSEFITDSIYADTYNALIPSNITFESGKYIADEISIIDSIMNVDGADTVIQAGPDIDSYDYEFIYVNTYYDYCRGLNIYNGTIIGNGISVEGNYSNLYIEKGKFINCDPECEIFIYAENGIMLGENSSIYNANFGDYNYTEYDYYEYYEDMDFELLRLDAWQADITKPLIVTDKAPVVTINANGGKANKMSVTKLPNILAGRKYNLNDVISAFYGEELQKDGYEFKGFYYDSDFTKFATGTKYRPEIVIKDDLTLHARWQEIVTGDDSDHRFRIYGQVSGGTYDEGKDAIVQLKRGNEVIAETQADNTYYEFINVEPGEYGIVAIGSETDEDGDDVKVKIVTDALSVEEPEDPEAIREIEKNLILPTYDLDSYVTVVPGAPDVMVKGLNIVAREHEEVSDDDDIEIELLVEPQDESTISDEAREAIQEACTQNSLELMDITISKYVNTCLAYYITDTGANVLEIIIPFNTNGRKNITAYRYHEGDPTADSLLEQIETRPLDISEFEDGKFFVGKGFVAIYATKFSIYGIGYDEVRKSSKKNPIEYLITFVSNGGSKIDELSAKANSIVNLDEFVPVRAGYKFLGWYDDKDLKNSISELFIANDKTVYAAWEEIELVNPTTTGVASLLITEDHIKYINGYENGAIGPNDNMTREEVAQMFYNLLLDKSEAKYAGFKDVAEGRWSAKAINKLTELGIIKGYDDENFGPADHITREQFCAMAIRFATKISLDGKYDIYGFNDVTSKMWSYDSVMTATELGWLNGYNDNSFRPTNKISRGEAVTIVNRMLDRTCDKAFVNSNANIKNFSDLDKSHWAYYELMEAANAHDYNKEAKDENWTNLK